MSGPPLKPEGMGWRVGVTVVAFFGAIIAVIVWLFFYAGGYNIYQNVAVVIIIILAFIAVMGGIWASWGMRQTEEWWKPKEVPGPSPEYLPPAQRRQLDC